MCVYNVVWEERHRNSPLEGEGVCSRVTLVDINLAHGGRGDSDVGAIRGYGDAVGEWDERDGEFVE